MLRFAKDREGLARCNSRNLGPRHTENLSDTLTVRSGSRPVLVQASDRGATILWEMLEEAHQTTLHASFPRAHSRLSWRRALMLHHRRCRARRSAWRRPRCRLLSRSRRRRRDPAALAGGGSRQQYATRCDRRKRPARFPLCPCLELPHQSRRLRVPIPLPFLRGRWRRSGGGSRAPANEPREARRRLAARRWPRSGAPAEPVLDDDYTLLSALDLASTRVTRRPRRRTVSKPDVVFLTLS